MTAKKETISERTERLLKNAKDHVDDTLRVGYEGKTEKLKKETKPALKKNGGARPGSGRKPGEQKLIERGIKAWVDQHINEGVEVTIIDKKSGKAITIKKQRVMYALEKLYSIGTKGEGNSAAIVAWLDRALGKAVQPMEHRGDKDAPLRLIVDF